MYKLDLERAEGPEIKLPTSVGSYKKQWIPEKHLLLQRWEYHTTLPASWETCMQVKKQQLELNIEQWSGSKLGKDYDKAVTLLFNLYAEYIMQNAGLDE